MVFLGLWSEEPELNFKSVQTLVNSVQQNSSAGEVHGLICGFLAAGSKPSASDWTRILGIWFETSPLPAGLGEQFSSLAATTLTQLSDDQLSFTLLLPDDDQPLADRMVHISGWCRGFLHGFGLSGNYRQEDLSADAGELLDDIAQISKMSDQPGEGDTEADYIEVLEYLRIGTIVLFHEHGRPAIH